MNSPGPWGTEDVDSLAWHDVHVRGSCLATFSERRGTADLVLDIDDIPTWESSGNGFEFRSCVAGLVVPGVFGLEIVAAHGKTAPAHRTCGHHRLAKKRR